jgi:hypothetical protein
MGAFNLLSVVTDIANTARQALQTFAVDSDKDTPRSLGYTACDTVGVALMGRAFHDTTDVTTATATAATALPAYTKRARLIIQNLSDANLLWFDFGTTAIAGACFKCFPGQILMFEGEACPPDLVSVVADAALTAEMFAKDW